METCRRVVKRPLRGVATATLGNFRQQGHPPT
jgi:hypothetical protein